jgi:hypothetical protein
MASTDIEFTSTFRLRKIPHTKRLRLQNPALSRSKQRLYKNHNESVERLLAAAQTAFYSLFKAFFIVP